MRICYVLAMGWDRPSTHSPSCNVYSGTMAKNTCRRYHQGFLVSKSNIGICHDTALQLPQMCCDIVTITGIRYEPALKTLRDFETAFLPSGVNWLKLWLNSHPDSHSLLSRTRE